MQQTATGSEGRAAEGGPSRPPPERPGRRAFAVGVAACLISLCGWALGPLFIRSLADDFDSWTQNFYRYLSAMLLWMPVLVLAGVRGEIPRSLWWRGALTALPNIAMQSCWAAALYYINPAFMALLTKSSLIWITLLSLLFFPEERHVVFNRRFAVGFACSIAGVIGVVLTGRLATDATLLGIGLALVEAFLWGVYVVVVRKLFRNVNSRVGFAVNSVYTTLGLGLAMAVFSRGGPPLPRDPRVWGAVVFSGVLSIGIAHTAYYAAMKRIGTTVPALVVLGSPFIVLALSSVLFGERFTAGQALWGLVLLAGAAVAVLSRRPPATPAAED